MGFFDRFTSRKPDQPATTPAAAAPTPAPEPAPKPAVSGGVMPRLTEARAKLGAKDLAGALAIYEEVLATSGDRADVLMTLSADLGVTGHLKELIEIVAPRYDAERHGPAAGLNLLQAYLAVRNTEAAQHLLDLLFSLGRPELEERLIGFSRALADIHAAEESAEYLPPEAAQIALVSISKPIWFYGLEEQAPTLLPAKAGRLRRVAFAQCALPGTPDALERAAKPEDALGRLCRGLPLWFADAFAFSSTYDPLAAVGTQAHHYALFPHDWVAENIRQINDSGGGNLDYVLTSSLRNRNDDFELTVRIWEVKKFRELKALTVRWTPATADAELGKFHALVRQYMEWTALPDGQGLAYTPPTAPLAYAHALGAGLTLFLGEKGILAPEHTAVDVAPFFTAAQANPDDPRAQLALVTALRRLRARGALIDEAAIAHARAWLGSPAAQAAGVAGLTV